MSFLECSAHIKERPFAIAKASTVDLPLFHMWMEWRTRYGSGPADIPSPCLLLAGTNYCESLAEALTSEFKGDVAAGGRDHFQKKVARDSRQGTIFNR